MDRPDWPDWPIEPEEFRRLFADFPSYRRIGECLGCGKVQASKYWHGKSLLRGEKAVAVRAAQARVERMKVESERNYSREWPVPMEAVAGGHFGWWGSDDDGGE